MDLSFAHTTGFERSIVTALPTELAVLLAGVAARQAASPTARVQARLALATAPAALLAPAGGAFSALTAGALRRWQGM